jgi:hypothetical protein
MSSNSTVQDSMHLHKKLNTELLCDSAIPFPGMYPKEMKTDIKKKTYMQMFTAALFSVEKK